MKTNSVKRTSEFQRNELLEDLLTKVNSDLQPAEEKLINKYLDKQPLYPVILIMGSLRSGTTLFIQWLANTGLVAYPTNLLSRFYQAPIIGARIQLMLTDSHYNFRNELAEFKRQSEYSSENGKTKGALAPNEFWYFWRRFLAEPSRDVWTDNELRKTMDTKTMIAELVGIIDVFQRPFAAKGMLFNYNIPFLDSVLDKVLFIQIRRNFITNVASVLEARKRQFGSESAWYSFKIPEYQQLEDLDPIAQTAGQIYYINKAISAGMSTVAHHRKLVVDYEDLCAKPHHVFTRLLDSLGRNNGKLYTGPDRFKISREGQIPRRAEIIKAISMFEVMEKAE